MRIGHARQAWSMWIGTDAARTIRETLRRECIQSANSPVVVCSELNGRDLYYLDRITCGHHEDRPLDEAEYLHTRDEQLAHRLAHEQGLSRREVFALGAAGSLLLARGGIAHAPARQASPIVKPLPPEWFVSLGTNAEMRWEAMADAGYLTPADRFFVRNHTATPLVDAATWRLKVFGAGLRRPEGLELSLRDLRRMRSESRAAFIECAGNGRSFFTSQQGTPAAGTQWKLGAVGVAHWRGVALGEVLERAGISRRAVDVMPQGLDAPVVSGGVDQGHVRRPLPVAKAFDDVLLAYEMNGRPLPPDHGFPVRLVVPGWIGVASIKWLGQLEVSDRPLFSPWNTTQYRMVGGDYPPDSPPLTAQQVKSAFELPWEARLPARRRHTLHGRSWSGDRPIRRVQVRIAGDGADGGWRDAKLHGPNVPHAWVRWSVDWRRPASGRHQLLARATDRAGTTQPDTVPFNANGYQFWAVVRHPVTVA
jgi:DMSO/TMAO reductase YedYZ molybdopterin-dependent catalytic subunit